MGVAIVVAIIVLVVVAVIAVYIVWRRRQRRKLDERRALAAQHRDMASMSHFEAEREAARENERAARVRREQTEAQEQKLEATQRDASAHGLEERADEIDPDTSRDG